MKSSLLTQALLGTNRVPALSEAPHRLLEKPWKELQTSSESATALLHAASLEGLLLRSGQKPLSSPTTPDPALPEELPYLPEPAIAPARRMLDGDYTFFLSEYLSLTASAKKLLPPRLLPPLFKIANRQPNLLQNTISVSGQRGQWLARNNSHWKKFLQHQVTTEILPEEIWEEGTMEDRIAWLSEKLDSNPEQAAHSIQEIWSGESPDNREKFTELAAQKPNPAHQGWLETLALSDRRRGTRQNAQRALLQLPESSYYQRTKKRFNTVISLKKKTLEIIPPESFDTEWKKDDLKEKPPKGTGEKAFWISQILSSFPITDWLEEEKLAPANLAKIKLDPDWASTILTAWLENLRLFPSSPELRQAVYSFFQSSSGLFGKKNSPLPPNFVREQLLTRFFPTDPPLQADLLEQLSLEEKEILSLLSRHSIPLDSTRHPKLLKILTDYLSSKRSALHRGEATALSGCPPPESIPQLLTEISKLPELPSAIEEFALALEFRQSYLQHF